MPSTRREFLRNTMCAAVGTTSIVRTLFDLGGIAAAADFPKAAGDYKALVCLFLYGGNDGNNKMIFRGIYN